MQIDAPGAVVEVAPPAPGGRAGDVAAHLVRGGQQRDGVVEVGGCPDGLAFGGAEGVGHVDVAEEDDGGVVEWGDAVVESMRGVGDGFLVVWRGCGEPGEGGDDLVVGFGFEFGPVWVVGCGLVDAVGETELGGLVGGEEVREIRSPACAAQKHVRGDFGSVFEPD